MHREDSSTAIPHDEAFKKLLQTFFAEFIALFFPELDKLLDHSQTRLLMQELLVDIVGEEARTLDLLIETRYRETDAFVLVHLEPQSYRQEDFAERMFIYFSRLFERHRKAHSLIIPIAVFTTDDGWAGPDHFEMSIAGTNIVRYQYLSVSLRKQDWRKFVASDNPIAAALLAKMGYNKKDKRELRIAYLRMLLRLRGRLDDARMALIMSVADLYFEPSKEEDESILREWLNHESDKGEILMELMPAWKRWGIEEGMEQGMEKGREAERRVIALRMLDKGAKPEEVADILGVSIEEIMKLRQS
ncbi:Rpn family recombination-promoting nuclease/putative transposase [Cohnella yongneupensis]|uniref:Rpn family recombination-promoting nuclease/putative transposase n=1 Tax=Cohnella yongneupensis TaxID=425006 RepID=A0ABW0R2F2_9BACL